MTRMVRVFCKSSKVATKLVSYVLIIKKVVLALLHRLLQESTVSALSMCIGKIIGRRNIKTTFSVS